MKFAFSTLGCPDFGWETIYSMAKDLGFSGIEMRGLGNNFFSVRAKPFTPENIQSTIDQLRRRRLEICCLSSGCALKYADRREQTIAEIGEYIALAQKLGTPYIRILGDLLAAPQGDEVDDEVVAQTLRAIVPMAEQAGVTLLVETNGVYADTARLARLLAGIQSDSVGALWDMHHPYR